jgi:hypothetical protein
MTDSPIQAASLEHAANATGVATPLPIRHLMLMSPRFASPAASACLPQCLVELLARPK